MQQLPTDGLPGIATDIRADPKSRQLIVTALSNRIRVSAGQDLDDMIQTKAEAVLSLHTMDAG